MLTTHDQPALSALRVIEAGEGIAGAYATKLLADLGAQVVKVERPGGDPLRGWAASWPDEALGEDGALFRFLNTSKRSVSIDHDDLVARLPGWADVVILGPGSGGLLAGDPRQWRSGRPELSVVTIVDGTGTAGPVPSNEFTLQAWCGSLSACQTPGGPPLQMGAGLGQWATGAMAALAALAGESQRAQSGCGLEIEVSALEVMAVCLLNYPTLYRQLTGTVAASTGGGDCLSVVRCRNGWVGLCIFTAQQWADFAALIGRDDLSEDHRLHSIGGRVRHRDLARSATQPWLDAHDVDEVVELCAAFRVPCAPIGTGKLVHQVDHLRDREVFVDNPAGFRQPRSPMHLSANRGRPFSPAPAFDADAEAVRAMLEDNGSAPPAPSPMAGDQQQPARPVEHPPSRPLEGLVVLDLTAFWAGPAATHVLATLGADVVKVESHHRPDGMRYASVVSPSDPTWVEQSPMFHGTNPAKRSVTIDFVSPAGRELLLRLVERSDVVIENFTPRVMDNARLTYDVLAERAPGLVVVRMPGFGLTGPWRDRSGFAQTMEQVSGVTWLTGFPDQMPLSRSTLDPISGMHAVVATLAALEHRRRTGEGQLVEVPMVEVALNVTAEQSVTYAAYGVELHRQGNRGPGATPQGAYRVSGESQWIALSVETDEQWRAVTDVLGSPPEQVGGGADLGCRAGRRSRQDEIDGWLGEVLIDHDGSEVVEQLWAAGVPAAPVWPQSMLDEQPALVASGFFQTVDHPVVGPVGLPGVGLRAGGLDLSYRAPAPLVGQHTEAVLSELLGCGPAELHELADAGAIATLP